MLQELNKELLIYLNNLSNINFIEKIVYIFADAPIFILPLFLVWFWLYYNFKWNFDWKQKLLLIFYSTILAIVINLVIQNIIHFERPEESLKNAWKLLLNHIPDASFPSDHAAVSFAFLASLFYFWYKKIWYILLPIFLIMVLSRIIAWVHWPFDILVWIIIWILSSFILFNSKNTIFLRKINDFIIKIINYIKL